jgi:hypothetical protein
VLALCTIAASAFSFRAFGSANTKKINGRQKISSSRTGANAKAGKMMRLSLCPSGCIGVRELLVLRYGGLRLMQQRAEFRKKSS